MSSVVIFRDEATGVVASWHKGGGFNVVARPRKNPDGTTSYGYVSRPYRDEGACIRQAQRKAAEIAKEQKT